MRKCLFFMSMRVVVLSKYFQDYYQRKLEIKKQGGSAAQEKGDPLCGGNKTDQGYLRALER